MTRAEILKQAEKCVCGGREIDYGKAEDNFQTIASLWAAYKGVDFSAVDVAMMMALLKVARIRSGNALEDSFVDLAGYAACGGEIAAKEREAALRPMNLPVSEDIAGGYNNTSSVMVDYG